MAWVGSEVLPHERDVRNWLRRSVDPSDLEDVIQEAYCRLSTLDTIDHIQSGRAYLFTTARNVVLERLRRARIVSIEAVTEIDALGILVDEPSPERIAAGRRELARVKRLIDALPDRCRRILELRKIDGLPQREVALAMSIPEYTVEYEVSRGLKLIMKAIAESEQAAEGALTTLGRHEQARDSRSD
ncbi:MAG: polymerase, sigma-24 subunit, subfamily [Bradyrhizobium sp.]|nr:polymerase, sigma-24 subunit, subfamily [Bradyrhizobium sp.]